MSDEVVAMRLRIEGRVQGVGFRDFVMREAMGHALDGWVRNRSDGTVEALVSGPETQVRNLIERCLRGPAAAQVTNIDLESADPPSQAGFRRRPTA